MKLDIKTEKAENFAVKIVSLFKYLFHERQETIMSKQLLRAGTSVGANITEANFAESRADFIHKLGIAQKECAETIYWLKLLFRSRYINQLQYDPFVNEAYELMKILSAIITKLKSRQ